MIEFLGRVDTARTKLEQVRQMRHRVAAIEQDIAEYRHLVQPLADKYGISPERDDHRQIGAVADALIEKLDNVRNLVRQRDEAKRQAEEYQRQLEQRERRLQEAEKALSDLLSAGGTHDPEELRRRARQHAERRELV
jgi:chromosome segregation ATPase